MKIYNRQTGKLGEDIAATLLTRKGYSILERNFANRYGEIDIIAKIHDMLVFVEVKAKKGIQFGTPEEMIRPYKLRKIQHMATMYMQGKTLPCRIDVVAIVLSSANEVLDIRHYENVYF